MASSVYDELREELRIAMRDDFGTGWTDDDLDEIIFEGQREYSYYSLLRTSELDIKVDNYMLPSNFIMPVKAYDLSGREIPIVSWKYLESIYPDFRKKTGDRPEFLCFDYDSYGLFRIFPKLTLDSGVSIGKLVYRRYATPEEILQDKEVVKKHSLFQMAFTKAKDTINNFFNDFLRMVYNKQSSRHRTSNRQTTHGGKFF